jgi:uncharacterized protein (DUF433 family)
MTVTPSFDNGYATMDWLPYIDSNPNILFGKPVFRNTRIPVDLLLEKLAAGESIDVLLQSYPTLQKQSILAALAFAADAIKNEIVYSSSPSTP